jgi:hypothetical protein
LLDAWISGARSTTRRLVHQPSSQSHTAPLAPAGAAETSWRQASPASWVATNPCMRASNCAWRAYPTAPCAHLDRPPAGWPARPPGRPVYPTCMRMRLWCSISRRAHAPRARTDAIAGRSHVRIAFRSLSPLPPPPPPPYYLTHAGKHGARDLLYYQESDLVPARQFTTPAAFMLVGTRN